VEDGILLLRGEGRGYDHSNSSSGSKANPDSKKLTAIGYEAPPPHAVFGKTNHELSSYFTRIPLPPGVLMITPEQIPRHLNG